MAVGAPSVASYLRMQPSHWAGVYACWGRENREAAVRFVTGMTGSEGTAANCEVKCFDSSANPYLAIGAVIAAGLAGVDRGLKLPQQVSGDPAQRSADELRELGVERLPTRLEQSIALMDQSAVLRDAMGSTLFDAFLAVRRAEWQTFGGEEPERVAVAHRWRY
jgi:glutamine synthetase